MAIDFTAIDFETANRNSASACSVGLVRVRDSVVVDVAEWLIKPDPDLGAFDSFNIRIHGITAEMVANSKSWAEQFQDLTSFIGEDTLIAHNAGFDMGVIKSACHTHVLPTPKFKYLCSVKVSRKTYDLPSHSLPFAAEAAGFKDFDHHNALDDALACSKIITDSARKHEQETLPGLAKKLGLQIATLKAIPLK